MDRRLHEPHPSDLDEVPQRRLDEAQRRYGERLAILHRAEEAGHPCPYGYEWVDEIDPSEAGDDEPF